MVGNVGEDGLRCLFIHGKELVTAQPHPFTQLIAACRQLVIDTANAANLSNSKLQIQPLPEPRHDMHPVVK